MHSPLRDVAMILNEQLKKKFTLPLRCMFLNMYIIQMFTIFYQHCNKSNKILKGNNDLWNVFSV